MPRNAWALSHVVAVPVPAHHGRRHSPTCGGIGRARAGRSRVAQRMSILRLQPVERDLWNIGGAHSALMLAARITLPHFSVSLAMNFPNSLRKFRRGSFILNLPSHHSITSSAPTCKVTGTVRSRVLAVLRFITNSNLVACITGKSDGFSPLRILPV
jgi:hypothetical protein